MSLNGDFYKLAEAVLNHLVAGGMTNPESRLWIAEQLGMLDDRRWFGEIGLPLSGNTPRHRAIARFAVEERLRAIVSLNWDTLLEVALDSVGLAEGNSSPRPWNMRGHARVIDEADKSLLADPHIFPVIKPHGCVRNLEQRRRWLRSKGSLPSITFKLTSAELSSLSHTQQSLIDEKVRDYVSVCPVIAVGWKAQEKYLRDTITWIAQKVKRTEKDSFTLVNRSWYPSGKKKEPYHQEIASAYGKTEAEAFVKVGNSDYPTFDQLFLWLQARYALFRLIAVSPTQQQSTLQHLLAELNQPSWDHPVLAWVDRWLPTWTRICWRAGVMQGNDPLSGRKVEPWDIPIMPRDVHVPLGCMTGDRSDLQAAAKLLMAMSNTMSRFNFEFFPGGIWDSEHGYLYLPLPGWRGMGKYADLSALKPQIETMRNWGFVRQLYLVWLDTKNTPPDQARCRELEVQVRRLIPLVKFADQTGTAWIDIEELKGDNHA